MTRYSITASYGPQFTWGAPETNLEQILAHRGIKVSGTEAGTDLQTGRRDVELIVDPAEQPAHLQFPEALHEAIDALVQTSERRLWVILPTDDVQFDAETGHGPKLSVVSDPADLWPEDEAAGIAAEEARVEEFERRPFDEREWLGREPLPASSPLALDELVARQVGLETKVEFRVLVDGRQLGREYDDIEDAMSAIDVINRVRERDRSGEPARIEARLVGTWQTFDVQPTPDRG